jgi:CheY-like chemotaxis protein
MPDSEDFLPELRRTLQSLRSAVHMLRQPRPEAGAIAFMCASAESRLGEIVEALEQRATGRRVLIADPERGWTDRLAETLRREGHQTETASTRAHALAACSAFRPEVVLLDVGMTGHEAARSLRGGGGAAVLVAVTGWGRADDRRLAMQAGVDHYLQKPISPAAVARLVSALPALA